MSARSAGRLTGSRGPASARTRSSLKAVSRKMNTLGVGIHEGEHPGRSGFDPGYRGCRPLVIMFFVLVFYPHLCASIVTEATNSSLERRVQVRTMVIEASRALIVVPSGGGFLSPIEPLSVLRFQGSPAHRRPLPGYLSRDTLHNRYGYGGDSELTPTKGVYIDIYV